MDKPSVENSDEGPAPLNPPSGLHGRKLIDVHFDELGLALGRPARLFEAWGEPFEWAAGARPEIDQHEQALGPVNEDTHEG